MDSAESEHSPAVPEILCNPSKADLADLHDIMAEAFPDWDLSQFPESLARVLESEDSDAIVARNAEGRIIGILAVSITNGVVGPRGWVEDVAVRKSERNKGYGHQLVQTAKQWFRDRRIKKVKLTTEMDKEPARHVYESEGFKQVDSMVFRLFD